MSDNLQVIESTRDWLSVWESIEIETDHGEGWENRSS
jgi:hypothetical protein